MQLIHRMVQPQFVAEPIFIWILKKPCTDDCAISALRLENSAGQIEVGDR
jgi:hypothetical protein